MLRLMIRLSLWRGDEMGKYDLFLQWNNEDNAFIVEIPELACCMADEQTYVEAVQNAEIAINEWIETAELMGRAIPEARRRLVYT